MKKPTEKEMIADPVVAAHATSLWQQTLALCTETNRHELGCWIQLDTATDTYCFTATTNGPPTPNEAVSTINLLPIELDSPWFPKIHHGSAVYTVASLHTHTPATYITFPKRPVGPSGNDKTASGELRYPGLVFDFDEDPNDPGFIHTGHPTNAPAHLYPTGECPRRDYQ